MGIFSKTKNTIVKEGLRAVGAQEISSGFNGICSVIKRTIRYNLTKQPASDLPFDMDATRYIQIQKYLKKVLFIFIFILFFAIIYCMKGLAEHNWRLFITSFGFSTVCLVFAFRYHFWLYQLKRRKLGCTFQEWYRDEVKVHFGQKQKSMAQAGAKKPASVAPVKVKKKE